MPVCMILIKSLFRFGDTVFGAFSDRSQKCKVILGSESIWENNSLTNKKQDMRVVSVTVKPTLTNCSGTIWFTDLMLQEGPALTGYVPHTACNR